MRVIQTIQAPGNDPVEIFYYKGDNLAEAIVAVGQAALASDGNFYTIIDVRLTF